MRFLHCCVAIYLFVAGYGLSYLKVRQNAITGAKRTQTMTEMQKPILAKANGTEPEDDDPITHAREDVWAKDRATIAKFVRRMLALRRRRKEHDHRDLPESARECC